MNISYTLTTCESSLSWLRTRKCLVVNKEGREGGRGGGRPTRGGVRGADHSHGRFSAAVGSVASPAVGG